jgi:hypothetical protein
MRTAVLRSLASVTLLLGWVASASADEWKEHTSTEGRYTAQFPGTPQQMAQRMDTKVGNLEAKVAMLSLPDNSAFYAVAFVDYPKEALAKSKPDELLDGARNGAVEKVKGKLELEEKVTMNGFPGRELKISAPGDLKLTARIYMVKSRLYQIIVVAPKAKEIAGNTKRFLDSFKFTAP